jgi:hypothetical protein
MSAILIVPGAVPVFDGNGDPVSGASIQFYQAGTTTPTQIFSDALLMISAGSVLTTNAAGEPITTGGGGSPVRTFHVPSAARYDVRISFGDTVRSWTGLQSVSGSTDWSSRGTWSAGSTYSIDDLVFRFGGGGGAFVALADNLTGAETDPLILANEGVLWQRLTTDDGITVGDLTGTGSTPALTARQVGGSYSFRMIREGAGEVLLGSNSPGVMLVANNAAEIGLRVSAVAGGSKYVNVSSSTSLPEITAFPGANDSLSIRGAGSGLLYLGGGGAVSVYNNNNVKMSFADNFVTRAGIISSASYCMAVLGPTLSDFMFGVPAVANPTSFLNATAGIGVGGPSLVAAGAAADIPLRLSAKGASPIIANAAVRLAAFTVSTLPAAATAGAGAMVWCSNARNTGEGAGSGTGSVVASNGTIWRIPGESSAVTD